MLTVLEAVQAEHPVPPRTGRTHWRCWRHAPIGLLFVYYAALCARWGNECKGPTYVDRDQLAGRRHEKRRNRRAEND